VGLDRELIVRRTVEGHGCMMGAILAAEHDPQPVDREKHDAQSNSTGATR